MLRKIHFCLLAGLIFTPAFSQQLGYIPFEKSSTVVSSTLEFAYDDWTIYQTALRAGNEEIAKQYYARALNYRNVFDKKNGFACPRYTDGSFKKILILCKHMERVLSKVIPGIFLSMYHMMSMVSWI